MTCNSRCAIFRLPPRRWRRPECGFARHAGADASTRPLPRRCGQQHRSGSGAAVRSRRARKSYRKPVCPQPRQSGARTRDGAGRAGFHELSRRTERMAAETVIAEPRAPRASWLTTSGAKWGLIGLAVVLAAGVAWWRMRGGRETHRRRADRWQRGADCGEGRRDCQRGRGAGEPAGRGGRPARQYRHARLRCGARACRGGPRRRTGRRSGDIGNDAEPAHVSASGRAQCEAGVELARTPGRSRRALVSPRHKQGSAKPNQHYAKRSSTYSVSKPWSRKTKYPAAIRQRRSGAAGGASRPRLRSRGRGRGGKRHCGCRKPLGPGAWRCRAGCARRFTRRKARRNRCK